MGHISHVLFKKHFIIIFNILGLKKCLFSYNPPSASHQRFWPLASKAIAESLQGVLCIEYRVESSQVSQGRLGFGLIDSIEKCVLNLGWNFSTVGLFKIFALKKRYSQYELYLHSKKYQTCLMKSWAGLDLALLFQVCKTFVHSIY